jgi:pimeloyl-ACP methyl ester carboxylesterase
MPKPQQQSPHTVNAGRHGLLVGALTALASVAPGCHAAREPVILVHGCPPGPPICVPGGDAACDNAEESRLWSRMIDHFRDRGGYPEGYLHTFVASGPPCDSTITQAAELAELVREVRTLHGTAKVDIVAHSMGALTTRLYLLDGQESIDDFVAIGGGNHGSTLAALGLQWQAQFGAPAYEGAKQMAPPYACEGETSGGAADIQLAVNGCLTSAGRSVERDETPGGVHYLSIWNSTDEIVSPPEASCLNQRFQNDCSDTSVNVQVTVPPGPGPCGPEGCPGHVSMLWDPSVLELTYAFLGHGHARVAAPAGSGKGGSGGDERSLQ